MQDQSLERLCELCRIPSVTTDRQSVAQAVDWLVKTYADESDRSEVLRDESGDIVGALITFGPVGVDRLVFYNYVDVVPAGDEAKWHTHPFEPSLIGGRLYARGAASNKGDLVARLEAAALLRASGRLRREVVCWIDAAEESGSPGFISMLEAWEDSLRAPLVLWNTGFVNAAGEPIIATGFKGLLITRLQARAVGYAGHSGIGVDSNPVRTMVETLARILDSTDLVGFVPARTETPSEREEDIRMSEESALFPEIDAEQALLRSTANVSWIEGGEPDELARYAAEATCALELRLVAPHRASDARVAIAKLCAEAGLSATTLMEVEAYTLDRAQRHSVAARLEAPLQSAFDARPRLLPVAPFSASAARVAEVLNAAIVSVGLTDPDSRPHEPNESINLEFFSASQAFVTELAGV